MVWYGMVIHCPGTRILYCTSTGAIPTQTAGLQYVEIKNGLLLSPPAYSYKSDNQSDPREISSMLLTRCSTDTSVTLLTYLTYLTVYTPFFPNYTTAKHSAAPYSMYHTTNERSLNKAASVKKKNQERKKVSKQGSRSSNEPEFNIQKFTVSYSA